MILNSNFVKKCIYLILVVSIASCNSDAESNEEVRETSKEVKNLFSLANNTGIDFVNRLTPTINLSTFNYQYFQNGGGVAVADFNNDDLEDLFFTSNLESDKLYLNKGDLKFEDITNKAKVTGFENNVNNSWSTGVTIGDVNNDGYPDIYVCKSGAFAQGIGTENLLFVNNRDLTFSEKGKEFGINDNGHSTQALFFDFDNDRDLDLFVLNHATLYGDPKIGFDLDGKPKEAHKHSCHLYKNENNKFVDVTIDAGVSKFAYGLGVVASDINDDGFVDIYVANDFSRPDFMFVNNGNGTFTDQLKESTGHVSYYSMGCDIADINNDGFKDISVVDMAPANNFRSKTLMPSMAPEDFNAFVNIFGYTYQYMFNALQINHGENKFSEVAKFAGVHKTDWSWATLLADFDNDGWKDMFVSNGYKFNKMENDFSIDFKAMKSKYAGNIPNEEKEKWLNKPPSYKLMNYIFKNEGGTKFSNKSKDWGLNEKTFSNGAAYADLDNDGDLDLILNNIDDPASVYINSAQGNYLQVELKAGKRWNPALNLNAKVEIVLGDKTQVVESTLTRGFQSSVQDICHFGLGDIKVIDQLTVTWLDGVQVIMKDVQANQRIIIDKSSAKFKKKPMAQISKLFEKSTNTGIDFRHVENEYDDFAKELLLPHKNSQHGPSLAKADVDGNGLVDFFIGGAIGQSGSLYLQIDEGEFQEAKSQPWTIDKNSEDMGAHFFDADQDQDLDLYVVSGGNEYENGNDNLQDRLYLNDGKGVFTKNTVLLPSIPTSSSVVVSFDQDKDGDIDLFVGGRMEPGRYPYASPNYLLINNNGKFVDKTETLGAALGDVSLVTDAIVEDVDKDGLEDLIIVGEWEAIQIFKNQKTGFTNITPENLLSNSGWWSSIQKADLDKDGDMDFVVGNLGLNYKYKASHEEPFHIYAYDFDKSGSLDIVLGYFNEGVCYPLRGRECSSEQMPFIKEKFPTYKQFASADLKQVYGEDLNKALHRKATNFSSIILINEGGGKFRVKNLPKQAQYSCINGIIISDLDTDDHLDIIIAGNLYAAEVETPRNDASIGLFLKGLGNLEYEPLSYLNSGINASKDVKDIELISTGKSNLILVANNNDKIEVFESSL